VKPRNLVYCLFLGISKIHRWSIFLEIESVIY